MELKDIKENLIHAPSENKDLRTEKLISHKCLVDRKLVTGIFLNDKELARNFLLSNLGSSTYGFWRHK